MEDSIENYLDSKTIVILSLLAIIAVILIFVAYQVNRLKKEELWSEFEQKFKQVSNGDSTVKVAKLLGQPSRIEKPPLMNRRTSIYDNQNTLYNNLDAITGATVNLKAKHIYFELWHYDIVARTYSLLFKPVVPFQHDLNVNSKYYPREDKDHVPFQ